MSDKKNVQQRLLRPSDIAVSGDPIMIIIKLVINMPFAVNQI